MKRERVPLRPVVTTSPIVRGMATAVQWVANPNYVCETFATREDGLVFIEGFVPD